MPEAMVQYYFKPNLFGSQILWIKKQVKQPDIDQFRYEGPMCTYTIERKATPSEAAALLPILNSGLSQSS